MSHTGAFVSLEWQQAHLKSTGMLEWNMSKTTITKPIELRGDRYVAHFDMTYHDNNMIQSPVPGPTSAFWIRLPEDCPLPESVSLEIGAQNIVSTSSFVPVQGEEKTTYEVQFFRKATLLPLHKLSYQYVQVIINGPPGARYENAEIVIHGDAYGTAENRVFEAAKVGEPLFKQTPGIDSETETVQFEPCFGEPNSLVVQYGCACLLYHF